MTQIPIKCLREEIKIGMKNTLFKKSKEKKKMKIIKCTRRILRKIHLQRLMKCSEILKTTIKLIQIVSFKTVKLIQKYMKHTIKEEELNIS